LKVGLLKVGKKCKHEILIYMKSFFKNAFFWISILLAIGFICIGLAFFWGQVYDRIMIADESWVINTPGELGNFIGGVAGSIWALAGVILLFATLIFQSFGLKENREQSEYLALLEIVYKHVQNYEVILAHFEIKYNGQESRGQYKGFSFDLIKKMNDKFYQIDLSDDQKAMSPLGPHVTSTSFFENNVSHLYLYLLALREQVEIVDSIITNGNLPESSKTRLKDIFIQNIGKSNIQALFKIQVVAQHCLGSWEQNKAVMSNKINLLNSIIVNIHYIEAINNKSYT
jgi:hypothetical protein